MSNASNWRFLMAVESSSVVWRLKLNELSKVFMENCIKIAWNFVNFSSASISNRNFASFTQTSASISKWNFASLSANHSCSLPISTSIHHSKHLENYSVASATVFLLLSSPSTKRAVVNNMNRKKKSPTMNRKDKEMIRFIHVVRERNLIIMCMMDNTFSPPSPPLPLHPSQTQRRSCLTKFQRKKFVCYTSLDVGWGWKQEGEREGEFISLKFKGCFFIPQNGAREAKGK